MAGVWSYRCATRLPRFAPIRSGWVSAMSAATTFIWWLRYSDQNVKLRRYPSGWVLKHKLLFETRTGSFELYNESAEFTYRFPVDFETLQEASRLLKVELPDTVMATASFIEEDFVKALAESSPGVAETRVAKIRSQYQFDNGWLELADVTFAKHNVQSISIHSPDLEIVKKMVNRLQPGDELEPMNYIEACRRWR